MSDCKALSRDRNLVLIGTSHDEFRRKASLINLENLTGATPKRSKCFQPAN